MKETNTTTQTPPLMEITIRPKKTAGVSAVFEYEDDAYLEVQNRILYAIALGK